jgi:hypothetical protein
MNKQYDVCILGATGAVGEAMLAILEQRKFPVRNLYPLASSRSAGSTVTFKGKELTVIDRPVFGGRQRVGKVRTARRRSRLRGDRQYRAFPL